MKKYLILILFSLFFPIIKVSAKYASFWGTFDYISFVTDSNSFSMSQQDLGRFIYMSSSQNIPINANPIFEFRISNLPSGNNYVYISGYSNISFSVGRSSFGECENIARSISPITDGHSSDINVSNAKPFGFKCGINTDQTDTFINLLGDIILNSGITYQPYVYLTHQIYVSDDSSNQEIQSQLKEQITQNQTIIEQNQKNLEKQQETNDKLQEQNDMQKEQNDYLMDDTAPSSDVSSLGNVQGLLPPGPLDSLLNIPFQFLSIINSSFGGVCKALDIDFVYDTTLSIPCFSEMFYNDVPPLLLNFLSLIPSAFILIQYFKHLYKKVDRAMNMESNADDEWGVI